MQAKIIALLKNFRKQMNITYLFISHDLSLVANFCDMVLVMYNGRMCEMGRTEELFEESSSPLHGAPSLVGSRGQRIGGEVETKKRPVEHSSNAD